MTAACAQSSGVGVMLEQAGQTEAAFEQYRVAAYANPDDASAFMGLVRLSAELRRSDTLAVVSRALVKLRPERYEYALGLVDALLGLRQTQQARAEAKKAGARWPDRAIQLADVFERHKEYADAVGYLREAQKRATNLAISARLVVLYEKSGDLPAATREIVGIVNRQPQAAQGYLPRFRSYGATTAPGLLAELDRIADPRAQARSRAAVLLGARRDADAVRVLKPALSEQELYMFAHEAEEQGSPDAALAVYHEQKAHADAARVLRKLGRTAEALAELAQDSGTGAQNELGDLQREERNFPAAAAAYQKVLERNPSDERAAFGLASVQLEQGRVAQARATATKPANRTDRLLFLIARTFFYEGGFDSASARVAELVRRFPQSLLVNDALELSVLTQAGQKATELARAMLLFETRGDGAAQARVLAQGSDPVAENAAILYARFLRRDRKPKEALAALDDYLQRFPAGSLRGRARLEQAYVFRDDLRDDGKFRDTLERLVVEEPGSAWGPLARNLLAESKKQATLDPAH